MRGYSAAVGMACKAWSSISMMNRWRDLGRRWMRSTCCKSRGDGPRRECCGSSPISSSTETARVRARRGSRSSCTRRRPTSYTLTKTVENSALIRYTLSHWDGLTRFVEDGRIEIDSNIVERSVRPLALNRKNALFAGSDGGGEHWAVIASLVETCKLNAVDPQAYLADAITKIVNGHPNKQVDELLPWAYPASPIIRQVA